MIKDKDQYAFMAIAAFVVGMLLSILEQDAMPDSKEKQELYRAVKAFRAWLEQQQS